MLSVEGVCSAGGDGVIGMRLVFIRVDLDQTDSNIRTVIRHSLVDRDDIFEDQSGLHLAFIFPEADDVALFHLDAEVIDDLLERFYRDRFIEIIIYEDGGGQLQNIRHGPAECIQFLFPALRKTESLFIQFLCRFRDPGRMVGDPLEIVDGMQHDREQAAVFLRELTADMEYHRENARLCRFLLSPAGDLYFRRKMVESIVETVQTNLQKQGKSSGGDMHYLVNYFVSGYIATVYEWLIREDKTPAQIAAFLLEMMKQFMH